MYFSFGFLRSAFVFLSLIFVAGFANAQDNVGIGTVTPDPSALLDLQANDKGLLVPRLTTVERTSIASPAHSLLVFDTTLECFFYYNATSASWIAMCPQLATAPANSTLSVSHIVSSSVYTSTPLSVNFTATNTSALIIFSASGEGDTTSQASVRFRINNSTSASTIGSTQQMMQNSDNLNGTIMTWSCSFTGLATGLVPGTTYTFTVDALTDGIFGTYNATIDPAQDGHHMSLSVIP